MMSRTTLLYGLLLAAWGTIVGWQAAEHHRVNDAARAAVIRRARDITTTLGVVIRSQRHFGGMVFQPRLESALNELVKSGELKSVVLLNAAGARVASAGDPIDLGTTGLPASGVRWHTGSVTVVNLIDLGASAATNGEEHPTIVLPDRGPPGGPRGDRPRFPPPPTNQMGGVNLPPPRGDRADGPPGPRPPPPEGRPRFRRPPWMNEEEFKSLIEKQGLHGIVIAVSTGAYEAAVRGDLLLRWIIIGFAGVAAAGSALAGRNLAKSAEFQIRLLRASEMNAHLREMNVAAAGLAHETRNPLNIIRGLAQMLSRDPAASEEVHKKSLEMAAEVDRVTAQLNEFINYSKPREVRRAPVSLNAVVADVVRALKTDVEDKSIALEVPTESLTIEADEPLLRQVLFNLLLNAVQAVPGGGAIRIEASRHGLQEACFEVRDNGPGVAPEHRKEVFRPYFTTHQKGTGLGLAVVKQIVLAHGWEIECLANEPQGALFRVSRLRLAAKA